MEHFHSAILTEDCRECILLYVKEYKFKRQSELYKYHVSYKIRPVLY